MTLLYRHYVCHHCGRQFDTEPVRHLVEEPAAIVHDDQDVAWMTTLVRCGCGYPMAPVHPRGMDAIASHILYQRGWPPILNHGSV